MYFLRIKLIRISILSLFLLFLVPNTAQSQPWFFLKNISGVGLFFENLTRHKDSSKLNLDSLYDISSKRLQKANIKIYRDSQWKNNWGGAFIKWFPANLRKMNILPFILMNPYTGR